MVRGLIRLQNLKDLSRVERWVRGYGAHEVAIIMTNLKQGRVVKPVLWIGPYVNGYV